MAANPNQYYHVIRKPLMTEKTTLAQGRANKYAFRVDPRATKPEIKKAIETLFSVTVEGVNVLTMPSKMRRVLGRPGRSPEWKKAVVTLKQGDTIELA
ncbi:MAG: 50S ribosomal protein L23 [Planctomycetota bacterium]